MNQLSSPVQEAIEQVSEAMDKFQDFVKLEKAMFCLSHGEWHEDNYVVPKDKLNLAYKVEQDLVLTREVYEEYVTTVLDSLTQKQEFITGMAFDNFQGIQWNFDNEPRIKEFLMASANKGNLYHQDLLLFETLKKLAFSKDPKVIKASDVTARQVFAKIKDEDMKKIPNIHIYRAALFNDYQGLVEKESKCPWQVVYEWNLSVRDAYIALKKIEEENPKIKEERIDTDEVMYWMVEKLYTEMKYIP